MNAKTTITRSLAAPAAILLLLAGCGTSDGQGDAPTVDSAPVAEAETIDAPEPSALGNLTGTSETGEVFTVNAPTDIPADIEETMLDAGIDQDTIDTAQLIPVDIDNTNGVEPVGILGLYLVNEAGDTTELAVLSDVLFEASEELGTDDADRYDRVWEAYEDSIVEVKPTAEGTDYVVAYDLPADDKYTYVAVAGLGWVETPVLIA